ncbi:hypothetical protein BD414DRAFT_522907 [Trametes punicea]|nr:hypothetical protein BD414DRAFT_522907 [Trametes punicea]
MIYVTTGAIFRARLCPSLSTTICSTLQTSLAAPRSRSWPAGWQARICYFKAVKAILPTELLDNIVYWLLVQKRGFSSIAAFASTSHRFRQIALRRYYAVLHVRSAQHWVRSCHIAGMFTWVRSLTASTTVFRFKIDGLARFKSLSSVELDFSGDGLSTQSSRVALLLNNMTADLTRMKLTHLPRVDSTLVALIASRFPSLNNLELSCVERLDEHCCWLCYEESSTCCIHSPIPDAFSSVDSLVTSFCKALMSLNHLETLFLGVFLSDADVLARHLERCATTVVPSPRMGYYNLPPPFGPDKCAICGAEHRAAVQDRERRAKALFKQSLPSLQNIAFSSWFSAPESMGPDTSR